MFEEFEDVLCIDDVCDYLMIGRNSAYKILNSGELKGFKIGRNWRIPRISLTKYIMEKSGIDD